MFVLFGLLPVVATFLACCAEKVPAYQRARVARYSQLLSQVTGLSVQVERVELLTPTRRLLYGVQLNHPETGVPLGHIGGLWISETPTGCAIQAQDTELVAEQVADCYRLLHEQVLCRPSLQAHALVMRFSELVIQGNTEAPLSFTKCQLELKRQPLSTLGSLRFRLDDHPDQEAMVTFDRHHDQLEPASHWTLNTGGQALPGAWVSRFAGNYSLPGAQAAFTGSYDLTYNQQFWNLSGSGHVLRIDASTWFERPLLSGLAYADIARFSMSHSGLKEATGSLVIQDGRIHGDLLVAAKDIGISALDDPEQLRIRSQAGGLPYQTIAADFQLDNKGLQIAPRRGDSAVAWDQVAIIARFGPYPTRPIVPLGNLAVYLSKTASTEAASTSTFSRIVQWLPHNRPDAPAHYQASQ